MSVQNEDKGVLGLCWIDVASTNSNPFSLIAGMIESLNSLKPRVDCCCVWVNEKQDDDPQSLLEPVGRMVEQSGLKLGDGAENGLPARKTLDDDIGPELEKWSKVYVIASEPSLLHKVRGANSNCVVLLREDGEDKWSSYEDDVNLGLFGAEGEDGEGDVRKVNAKAQGLAKLPRRVFIFGETGTGKSRIARYIHEQSGRRYHTVGKKRFADIKNQDRSLAALFALAGGDNYSVANNNGRTRKKDDQDDNMDRQIQVLLDNFEKKKAAIDELLKNERMKEINLAGLSDETIESELFGYVHGAYTGSAQLGRPGLFISSNGGTLLLDEITECSPEIQAKLLTVIQSRDRDYERAQGVTCPCYVKPVGQEREVLVDVRVVVATNKSKKELLDAINDGRFRKDLYYRLAESILYLPSFSDFKPETFEKFIRRVLAETNVDFLGRDAVYRQVTISKGAVDYLVKKKDNIKGNYRELQNLIGQMCTGVFLTMRNGRPGEWVISEDDAKTAFELLDFGQVEKDERGREVNASPKRVDDSAMVMASDDPRDEEMGGGQSIGIEKVIKRLEGYGYKSPVALDGILRQMIQYVHSRHEVTLNELMSKCLPGKQQKTSTEFGRFLVKFGIRGLGWKGFKDLVCKEEADYEE